MESDKWQFYRTISGTLAISLSTAIEITTPFCEEMLWLSLLFVNFPREIENKANENFRAGSKCKIPQRVVEVDGTYVSMISRDTDCKPDYYCRKQIFSINTQDTVDGKLFIFRWNIQYSLAVCTMHMS